MDSISCFGSIPWLKKESVTLTDCVTAWGQRRSKSAFGKITFFLTWRNLPQCWIAKLYQFDGHWGNSPVITVSQTLPKNSMAMWNWNLRIGRRPSLLNFVPWLKCFATAADCRVQTPLIPFSLQHMCCCSLLLFLYREV